MNKAELLDWVNSLPDDAEVDPVSYSDIKSDPQSPEWIGLADPRTYMASALYSQSTDWEFKLVVRFRTTTEANFTRTSTGREMWSNVRRTK